MDDTNRIDFVVTILISSSGIFLCALAIAALNILISKIQESCSNFDDSGFDEGNLKSTLSLKNLNIHITTFLFLTVS